MCSCYPGYVSLHYFPVSKYFSRTSSRQIQPADKDGDGIDDQADILQSALDYIAAKPKYKSKYYRTGYPDDGYVIHHNSPWQKKYEQDILEKREDLVGHYRISQ